MLMCEFLTAVQHKLPVKVVVYNNSAFGLISFEGESVGLPAYKTAESLHPERMMKQRFPLKQRRPTHKPPPFSQPQTPQALHKRLDKLLEEALKGTFPVSDAFDIGRWTEPREQGDRERVAKFNAGAGKL